MAHVLVVDDEESVRRIIRRLLEYEGHQVTLAPEGETGLLLYMDCAPDLVITDIVMPKMDGIEMIRALRAADSNVRIIAMSGGHCTNGNGVLSSAAALGARRTLTKPFSRGTLIEAVSEVLQET